MDIVERLRTTSTKRTYDSVGRAYDCPESLLREAAEEIERLRKAQIHAETDGYNKGVRDMAQGCPVCREVALPKTP